MTEQVEYLTNKCLQQSEKLNITVSVYYIVIETLILESEIVGMPWIGRLFHPAALMFSRTG